MNEHELRRTVVGEMHLRRWPPISAPRAIIQIVTVVDQAEREAERAALDQLPLGAQALPSTNPRHRAARLAAGISFSWERHSEASTLTLFLDVTDDLTLPVANPEGNAGDRALSWVLGIPGKVIRATRLLIVDDEAQAEALVPEFDFDPLELVSCHIGTSLQGARARIWGDFRLRADGFGFVLVAANGMQAGDLTRTIQRFQELGNYRNMALLGLPVAQAGWKRLDEIEQALSGLTEQVARPDVIDDNLLEQVSRLSMELVTESTASDFRMSATEAYAKIVEERLSDLCITPCQGFQSLSDFTQRRLFPAVRFCSAHSRRSQQLADRTSQFVSLFRTRIETRIENQNARLLASMERNAARQVRLQQLVEGFSVVALTYYGISLLHYVLEGAEAGGVHMNVGLMTAMATPLVALLIWGTMHRLKSRVFGPNE